MIPRQASENPFPIEAVATYGTPLRTCEHLAYMTECQGQLNEYLVGYQKTETRYGCSIGLRGGHGSGKTHVLSWLGQQAAGLSVSKPIVLYAKADRASFFDLYTQLLGQLKRTDLLLTIAEAVKYVAVEEVNKAEATRSIEKRLQTSAELENLFREQNLDREALFLTLRERLQISGAPEEIIEAVLLIESPTLGEKAYSWLSGKRLEDPQTLGIPYQLDMLPVGGETTSIPDVVAVNALETMAALFALARRPLIILIDQLEILLRTDIARRQTLSSVIKKLIEQLGRQNVLTFIAGTPEPWDALPRDVAPRLRTREPLPVGTLNAAEAKLLLESYHTGEYATETLDALIRVSGGNPREILRISHHVFAKFTGELARATPDDVVECAKLSGTLDDRRKLALAEVDQAFAAIGTVLSDVDVGGEVPVDRLLQAPPAQTIALITLTAADRVSEATFAKRLISVIRRLMERWRGARVVVISVGYSTETIRRQLGGMTTLIEYSEGSFARALQGVLAEAIREGDERKSKSDDGSMQAFQRLADSIDARITKIESERALETKKILEDFIAKTRMLAEPERQRRELRSRWDILDELSTLAAANQLELREHRESVRAVLVANETSIKDSRLDFLGSIYLDCLTPSYLAATEKLRSNLLLEMQRGLRLGVMPKIIFSRPWVALAILAGVVTLLAILLIVAAPYLAPVYGAHSFTRWVVVGAMSTIAYSTFSITYYLAMWRRRWNRRFEEAIWEVNLRK